MRDRILVIDGHPDASRDRLCHALADAYVTGARSSGLETRLITVSELDFPLLRTAREFSEPPDNPGILRAREDLVWCNHVALVFPLWLGGAPSLLRAFFEQVARGSFVAEASGRGIQQKLKGRSARLIVTMGMPAFAYSFIFHEHGVRNVMQGILGFGGISPIHRTLFGAVEAGDAKRQTARIEVARKLGASGA
jgi:putative NADPH-quinone reductase